MQSLRIWLLCLLAAIVYGILHDQVTARVCLEYFTVYHPPIFHTNDPTLLAFGWGVIATWWMGAILGAFITVAAQVGRLPKLVARELLRPLGVLLGSMGALALIAGIVGYHVGQDARFSAAYFAHNTSYGAGTLGTLVLVGWIIRERVRRGVKRLEGEKTSIPGHL